MPANRGVGKCILFNNLARYLCQLKRWQAAQITKIRCGTTMSRTDELLDHLRPSAPGHRCAEGMLTKQHCKQHDCQKFPDRDKYRDSRDPRPLVGLGVYLARSERFPLSAVDASSILERCRCCG